MGQCTAKHNIAQIFEPVDRSIRRAIAKKFAPICYLDHAEQYFPASIEYICDNSQLLDNAGHIITARHALTPENLLQQSKKATRPTHIEIPSSIFAGNAHQLQLTPFYYKVYQTADEYVVQYCFLYPYNGPFIICGKPYGQHQGDLEHVSVFVSKQTERITQIYFGAHDTHDGYMADANDILTLGGRPIVYIARHSHATYHTPGVTYRICCLANDHADGGIKWDPETLVDLDDASWNDYTGYIGQEPTFKYHAWYGAENEYSSTCCTRLCCVWL